MFTKIMTPLKKGDLERIPISPPQLREAALTRSAQLTSLRQACEWGMGAVTKVYRVLLVKLPFAQDKRGRLIKNCFMLYNFALLALLFYRGLTIAPGPNSDENVKCIIW
jgi:hypothetical protein